MQDLVQHLKDKAGLTDEQAIKAISAMKEYLQGKVPPMFSGFVDQFFAKASAGHDDPLSLP
jgi:hypothetical protein